MIQVLSDDEYDRELNQRYMRLQNTCKLSPDASYNQYIEWFVKRFDVYYQKYWIAFCLFLANRGFPSTSYTSCRIREDIEDMLRQKGKKGFYEIFLMDPLVRLRRLDMMTSTEFEKFLQWFFSQQGYLIIKTKTGHEQGTDFILITRNIRIAIEAKRWNSKVGNRAVQQINSGKLFHRCDRAWVITNNYFTEQAKELARSCNVELINRDGLNEMISRVKL